jgi:transposase
MQPKSPFLNGFHRLLGGRKPSSALDKLLRARRQIDVLCGSQLKSLFGPFLPEQLLAHRNRRGAGSRERVFSRAVTFWAFLGQVLDPASSCRMAVARVQALFALKGLKRPGEHTGAYCEARLRLPVRWLMELLQHVTTRLTQGHEEKGRLLVVDGTTATLPDTVALQRRYPQAGGQQPGCGFPLLKLLGLFDLRSGAWLATTHSSRKFHDARLWRRLFWRLGPGDTVIVDRAFCGYFDVARLITRGVQIVVRLHQRRKTDFRKGQRLGSRDHLVSWLKPQRPDWMSEREYASMPEQITVREVQHQVVHKAHRTRELILVTTLLNAKDHPKTKIAELYARRWRVELCFDDLKTTMHMEMLRTKSPATVCRELLMHMIAYNLLRAVIMRAEVPAERASFKGTVDRLHTWSWPIWLAPTPREARSRVDELLASIACDLVPERPGRREPRAVKRRPKPHALLNVSRHRFKEIPHREHYRKAA